MSGAEVAKEPGLTTGVPLLMGTFRILAWKEIDGLSYYIARSETQKSLVLAFRGSVNLKNWETDADAKLVKPDETLYPGAPEHAMAHHGMQVATRLILDGGCKEQLKTFVQGNEGYQIVVVGHSLGGGLALNTFAALSFDADFEWPLRALYTYGQPLVGNAIFADWIASKYGADRHVRFVSSNDIVPFLGYNDVNPLGGKTMRHAASVAEVWMKNPHNNAGNQLCNGANKHQNSNCAESASCESRKWENHSYYGGMLVSENFCLLGKVSRALPKSLHALHGSRTPSPVGSHIGS